MTQERKKIFEEMLIKLPKEIQEVITSSAWEKTIEEIGNKCDLLGEEIEELQVEASMVLLGFEDPDLYVSKIENGIGLAKDEAKNINQEIQQKVFGPIFDEISRKMNLEKDAGEGNNPGSDWKNNIDYIVNY